MTQDLFIGIDVSKAKLDVAASPGEHSWTVSNTEEGIQELISKLRQLGTPKIILMEATGGFERRPLVLLGAAGLPVTAINPRNARDFAKSIGLLAMGVNVDGVTPWPGDTELRRTADPFPVSPRHYATPPAGWRQY